MSNALGISNLTNKITALVVEDDLITQKIHHKLLDHLGVESQVVKNGKEAVNVHNSENIFDIILMDRDMPIMNGIEATKQLRAMDVGSFIVGISSHSLEEEKKEFIEAGLDDYYEKPLTIAKLISIINKVNSNR